MNEGDVMNIWREYPTWVVCHRVKHDMIAYYYNTLTTKLKDKERHGIFSNIN